MEVKHLDVVLCEFYFSDFKKSYEIYLNTFCKYFGCENKKDRI